MGSVATLIEDVRTTDPSDYEIEVEASLKAAPRGTSRTAKLSPFLTATAT